MTARLAVRLVPRGGVDRIEGVDEDGALRVRVAAPPVDGAANAALCRLLASELGVGRGDVRIVSGQTGRRKVVEVDLESDAIAARWDGLGATQRRPEPPS